MPHRLLSPLVCRFLGRRHHDGAGAAAAGVGEAPRQEIAAR